MNNISFYTKNEEIANFVTHCIGAALSVAALVLLTVYSSILGDPWCIVSCVIFGVSLIILYTFSSLYHALTNKKAKKVFRIFDHISIYILIAGTYTPFTLTILRGPMGWTIFGTVWGIAVIGIILKVFFINKFDKLSTLLYVLVGWLIIMDIKPVYRILPRTGFILLVLGGVIYTLGSILYSMDKIPYNHAVWHLFVLAGSICHFFAIFLYLIPVSRM